MKTAIRMFVGSSVLSLPLLLFGCEGESKPGSSLAPPPDLTPPDSTPTETPSIVRSKTLPPAISGGTLAVLKDGKTAVAADPDRDQIYVVDLVAKKVTHTLVLSTGDEPGRHVQDASGVVHVALRKSGALLSFDPITGKVLSRRQLCSAPRGLAFDSARNLLHVACADGQLVSIEPNAAAPLRSVRLDRDLRDVVVKGDLLFVSTFRQANVLTIDAGTGGLMNRSVPIKTQAAFLSNGFFGKINPGQPSNSASQLNTASPAVAWRMVAGADGNPVVIHQRGFDGMVQAVPNGYGNAQSCSGVVESAISALSVDGSGTRMRSTRALDHTVLPVDIAIAPGGRQAAFVAAGQGERTVQFMALNAMDNMATESQPNSPVPNGGSNPCMVASPTPLPEPETSTDSAPDGLPVPIEFRPANGEVIAVAYDLKGNVVVQSRNPANIQILTQRAAPIVLSTQGRYDIGLTLFHASTPGQIACASCHPEGGEDSRTWAFSDVGVRRTQSLRGGIAETAPFHWDGQLADMSSLMADVFQQRMGGGPVSEKQVGALSSWIDSIPRLGLSSIGDNAAADRGKVLFHSPAVGCSTCHAGSKLTNNKIADVGTGRSFQTPQLMDLALHAPYMHNGCAKTLRDRFGGGCGGDDRHGVTSKLSPDEVDDLVVFLETL